ncbi:ABC transporter ATP-binding protein [Pseudodesulfovibrio sediminis]|uniref:ABC transporter ATP-binding protein n=1 Tax=Pseudodesulfovibrio sediminis TaxID=2810563 RepID=A0ABM7P5C6_9BACT|nr:ABC transporter ATP-binding protein [Pseudodesulfovibrio sediminis]BCS88134.1 ABC transporter ATP-binding protein [Pseudodesulfovibrio sediminis]
MRQMITCRDLRHSYGDKVVLDGLSFDIEQGGIFGLLGKNGAGKTTTINILMGFLQPLSGECRVLGLPSHGISPEVRQNIGLLHEQFIQYDFMGINEIERFHSRFYPKWERDVFYDLVSRLDVPHDRRISRMSCGQRSQVVLGLIMAQKPALMILDDYSMGLDVGYRRLFLDFLQEYVREQGTTVLLTSHVVQDLDKIIDRMIIIQHGRVLVEGHKETFLESFRQFRLPASVPLDKLSVEGPVVALEQGRSSVSVFGYCVKTEMDSYLSSLGIPVQGLEEVFMDFEDAFIGITGKY